uniref:Uncharacterized protein n=1 Tax=Anguilla anguilla TaxID=7936 RepID=A0A0E9QL03_ANGAN
MTMFAAVLFEHREVTTPTGMPFWHFNVKFDIWAFLH